MKWTTDQTHDPGLRSWVASANDSAADFPIQNLPFGVFMPPGGRAPRIGTAIGSQILDLRRCHEAGLLGMSCLTADALNPVMALSLADRCALRARLSAILSDPAWRPRAEPLLSPAADCVLQLPAAIGDYTDFYASVFHATNVGRLFRPDNPLLPNYKYVPIGYHGRASSIVPSGTPVQRPSGQFRPPGCDVPVFGPGCALDYELEIGFFIGRGNELGTPIPIADAQHHIFGCCLLNDWSARDLQVWEGQPLGPFLAKNFATSISPWVVTMEALAPYRTAAFERAAGDPAPLPYLNCPEESGGGGIDLTLEVWLSSRQMRDRNMDAMRISSGNLRNLYWTPGQLVTHHASGGCNLRTGDLIGTGTVSGPEPSEYGCLLEITRRGQLPLALPTGETRSFLSDGDEVIFRGYCSKEGWASIGLGECRGIVHE